MGTKITHRKILKNDRKQGFILHHCFSTKNNFTKKKWMRERSKQYSNGLIREKRKNTRQQGNENIKETP